MITQGRIVTKARVLLVGDLFRYDLNVHGFTGKVL